MKNFTPLHDKVVGRMIETVGAVRQTESGLYLGLDDESSETFVRPRWFEVTHVGDEQKDVVPGQYVLVPHGRWSHGFNLDGSLAEVDKLFQIDHTDMLLVSDEAPNG